MVNAAIASADPKFRIYFNESHENPTNGKNFTVILGAKLDILANSSQKGGV